MGLPVARFAMLGVRGDMGIALGAVVLGGLDDLIVEFAGFLLEADIVGGVDFCGDVGKIHESEGGEVVDDA